MEGARIDLVKAREVKEQSQKKHMREHYEKINQSRTLRNQVAIDRLYVDDMMDRERVQTCVNNRALADAFTQ